MSNDLFMRIKRLLESQERTEESEAIIEELNVLLKSDACEKIEHDIDEAERKMVSDDIADEILNGKYCVGGNCED
jgi:hypothetical protein